MLLDKLDDAFCRLVAVEPEYEVLMGIINYKPYDGRDRIQTCPITLLISEVNSVMIILMDLRYTCGRGKRSASRRFSSYLS